MSAGRGGGCPALSAVAVGAAAPAATRRCPIVALGDSVASDEGTRDAALVWLIAPRVVER